VLEDGHGFARLYQQGFILVHFTSLCRVARMASKASHAAGGLAAAAVDNQLIRQLCHLDGSRLFWSMR
jgi:hypothetical protein